jgi:16S rRNA processing protein RimM
MAHHAVREAAPPDLIGLGAVRGAFGVKGWVRITPFAADAEVLRATRSWWLVRAEAPMRLTVTGVRQHADLLLAKWEGCETPEAADALKGAEIAVARGDFPVLEEGQYYWVDLIGARVVNRRGVELGEVQGLRNNGAQDLLEVGGNGAMLLVPMVEAYIDRIDLPAHRVQVDWEADW